MKRNVMRFMIIVASASLLFSLASCGGGGGSSSTPGGTQSFKVGGGVSGLWLSNSFVLHNSNSGEDLTILSNGTFTFSTAIKDGGQFSITVKTQPAAGQTCTVTNGTGTIAGADATNASVFCSTSASYRDSSGTEFILGIMPNVDGAEYELALSGDKATTGTVLISALSFSQTFTVTPGSVTHIALPAGAEVAGTGRAVRITSVDPVFPVGMSSMAGSADGFLALPTDVLSTDYRVLSYPGLASGGTTTYPSQAVIAAWQDATTVTVVTPVDSSLGAANTPHNLPMSGLDTYLLTATGVGDLSGTRITSDKPIAVFSGNQCTQVPNGKASCDYLVEQVIPAASWGTVFYTVPLATRTGGDILRVMASTGGTVLTSSPSITGLVATLDAGQLAEVSVPSTTYAVITATKPLTVKQYAKGYEVDGVTNSDPFMMTVQGQEQFLTHYTLVTGDTNTVSFSSYVNLVIQDGDISSCLFDGAVLPALTFTPFASGGYSGAQMPVAAGAHTIMCPHKFGASVYGFAEYTSYGYPAGLLVP